MGQYVDGTITFTNGSANVVGVGTLFLANVSVGDWISLQGQGNLIYFVLSVTDDTNLVLTTTYAGATASGQAYWTFNYFTSPDNLPILSENDVDTHRIMSRLSIELQTIISDLKANEVSNFTDEVNQILTSSAIVSLKIWDTTLESDGGNSRFLKKSWYSESTPSGIFVGRFVDEAAARAGGGLENDWYARTGTTDFYKLNASTETQIYRAGRSERPKFALVLVESDKIVIFDLTTPLPSMWMCFVDGEAVPMLHTKGALSISEGVIFSGRSFVNFASDNAGFYSTSGKFVHTLTIEDRNVAGVYHLIDSTEAIVNTTVNDVAMCVLPDAPIDSVTGLKVPTIAVATDGGISVITDNRDVFDSSSASKHVAVFFDNKNILIGVYDTGITQSPYRAYTPASYKGGDGFTNDWLFYHTESSGYTQPVMLAHPLKVVGNASGSANGLTQIQNNFDNSLGSMVAYITKDYNTGWTVGDIRGCLLADSNVGSIVGSELVTNGTFDTNITGWTDASTGTGSISWNAGGYLDLNSVDGSNRAIAKQSFATVIGETYTFAAEHLDTDLITIYLGSIDDGQQYDTGGVLASNTTIGWMVHTFVATTTTVFIKVWGQSAAVTSSLDNVSMHLAVDDRSVKANGAQVFGTITKTLIDTNSELVAYSGFSASNYLEQPYNAVLDFGTSDFYFGMWLKENANTAVEMIFSRGYFSGSWTGSQIRMYINADGTLHARISDDGFATNDNTTSTNTIDDGQTHFVEMFRSGSSFYIFVDGVEWAIGTVSNAVGSLSNSNATLRIGENNTVGDPLTNGSLALFRASATVPTAEQRKHIYETERQMIVNKCLLDGDSNAITALNFNEKRNLLSVGTSWGRTDFNNLVRVDSEATSVGSLTAIAYDGDLILNGGASGSDILIPEIDLRAKLIGTDLEIVEDHEWQDVTFENSWVNYGSVGNDTQYRKLGDNVELRGLVKDGVALDGTIIFILPNGFRPKETTYISTTSAGAFSQVEITKAGNVQFAIGSSTWLSLDNISFSIS